MTPSLHLVGQRIRIDTFAEADLTLAYVDWLNDPEVVRYSNQRFRQHDLDSCRAYFESFEGSANRFFSVKSLEGQAIGTMTVYQSVPHGTADMGIMIGDRASWGGGFGREAWNVLLDWLLSQSDVRKVTAGAVACNRSSIRMIEQSGMLLEGVRRAQEIIDGEPQDVMLFGKFAP